MTLYKYCIVASHPYDSLMPNFRHFPIADSYTENTLCIFKSFSQTVMGLVGGTSQGSIRDSSYMTLNGGMTKNKTGTLPLTN